MHFPADPPRNHTACRSPTIRLALVEDETLIREGLALLIGQTPGLRCEVIAGDHATAVLACAAEPPEVALLDITSPDAAGSEGIALWIKRLPQVRLLLFDEMLRDIHLRWALRIGAAGYVTKRDSFADWVEALHGCLHDAPVFSPTVQPRVRRTPRGWELHTPHDAPPGLHCLTARETEVLSYLAQGFTGKQCSAFLGISPSTVDNHKSRIMRKLKVRKTVELTRLALREGLVPR